MTVDSKNEMRVIYDLLKQGDEQIKLSPGKDVVLLVGNTGGGKSTLAQFLVGNSAQLFAQEVEEGSGEYIIVDHNSKLSGNSTVLSQTTFPDLVIDTSTNTTYYDCPGFSDTRSAAHEIAATYFTKKVIDAARSVKLVFVVSHHSLRRGMDRKDFVTLLKHAADFIKDMDRFKDSIAIVVTKVENQYVKAGKDTQLVPDSGVIKTVTGFIERVRQDILAQPLMVLTSQGKITHDRALKFLEALLFNENKDRIGIFRRPNKPGVLSSIELLQDELIPLRDMINKNIRFVGGDEKSFGYTISSNSKIYINGLVEEIYKDISYEIVGLGEEIEQYYTDQEQEMSDIEQMEEKFQLLSEFFHQKLTAEINEAKSPHEFLSRIKKVTGSLNITTSDYYLSNISKQEEYIRFLYYVNNESLRTNWPSKLVQGFVNLLNYFNESQNWYSFLVHLYARLSHYDVQKEKNKYKIMKISKFSDFTNSAVFQLIKDSMKRHNDVEEMKLNNQKLNHLKRVLELTLNSNIEKFCPTPHNLIVKGQYVQISDVKREKCNKEIKFIEVLAFEKVFIDTSLDLTGMEAQVAIVAPVWEVVGSQSIILDGGAGDDHNPSKAPRGIRSGSRGDNGKPGTPGGPAGSFLGIGKKIINDKHLFISANGGDGGRGQDGGDGSDGADGSEESEIIKKNVYIVYNEEERWIPGQDGGDGGNGGFGGYGGSEGNITFIEVGRNSPMTKATMSAAEGARGQGGSGGVGGKGGRYLSESSKNILFVVNVNKVDTAGKWASDGRNGKADFNLYGIQNTWETKEHLIPNSLISKFISDIRGSLNGNLKESFLREFLNEVDQNERISRLYSTLSLVEEFKMIELHFDKEENKSSLVPRYQSLLQRITLYAKNPRESEKSPQYMKVLSYLYTAILTRVASIQNGQQSNLIIDLKAYLELVTSFINKLTEMSHDVKVNELYSDRKESIKLKVNEANDFVNTQVKRKLELTFSEIDDSIISGLKEIAGLKRSAYIEKEKLSRKKEKGLEESLIFKSLLKPIKIASSILQLIPDGGIIGKVIDSGIHLVSGFFSNDGGEAAKVRLPEALSGISDIINSGVHLFLEQLNDIDHELKDFQIKENSSTLEKPREKILDIRQTLEKGISEMPFNPQVRKIGDLRQEIKELLTNENEKLNEMEGSDGTDSDKIRSKINNVLNIVAITTDLYRDIKNQTEEINGLGSSIQRVEKKIRIIEQYEEDIIKIIEPLFRNLQLEAQVTEKQNVDSHIAVEIRKWKIQNVINDVKRMVYKLIKGFNLSEGLMHCIDNLQEGMTTMINVFDLIESYQDEIRLYSYISQINSSKMIKISITDEELKKAVDDLNFIIQSNIILGQYERAVSALKQCVFPFASLYLEEFSLPPVFKFEQDVNGLAHNTIAKMEDLKLKFSESAFSIGYYDKHVHSRSQWRDGNDALFFVWSFDSFREAISNLLEGKEVLLEADITKSHSNRNAMKFNVIDIAFKARDKALQEQLNEDLENFEVTLVHFGNSYYRCGDKFYIISSDRQTFSFYLKKNKAGEPTNTNLVYDKIKKNDFMLSPYAMWSIKLTQVGPNLGRLHKYQNQSIDIELRGREQYVDEGINKEICNEKLEYYYRRDYSLPEPELLDLRASIYREDPIDHAMSFPNLGDDIVRKRRFADEGELNKRSPENRPFMTSGTSSVNKNSFINNILNVALTYLEPFRARNFFFKSNRNDLNKEIGRFESRFPYISLPEQSAQKVMGLSLESASMEHETSFLNFNDQFSSIFSHSNLLLWDLFLKKFTRRQTPPAYSMDSHEERCEFASSLAYSHYAR